MHLEAEICVSQRFGRSFATRRWSARSSRRESSVFLRSHQKRQSQSRAGFITRPEIDALLEVPDQKTWLGRRDRVLLFFTIQTGLRFSEIIGLRQGDIYLKRGAHVRCEGKGRKQRCTPLTRTTVHALKAWVHEEGRAVLKILKQDAFRLVVARQLIRIACG